MTYARETVPKASDEVNRAQREYWSSAGATQYRDYADTNEAMSAGFGQVMLDLVRLQPGEQVLDVGCGHATTTIDAAKLVAPSGRVVGVDISAAMLDHARLRIKGAGLDNVELRQADAQKHRFEAGSFDVVISRFGLMFFDDALAAFGNLADALRPGGRLAFVCPQDPRKSEWVAVALGAAVAAVGRAPDLGPPGSPGPFAFADGDRLAQLLTRAGFRNVTVESLTQPVRLGSDVDDAAAYILSLPQSQQLFANAPRDVVETANAALRAAFAPYAAADGVVLNSAAWLVLANR